jgi:GT2 family glycosyltransferase
VGAKLLFPDGRVQHAGVVIQDGHPVHQDYGEPQTSLGPFSATAVPRNCVAVTAACLMTRAEVFHGQGGFSEAFPLNYNDIDYCFRVRAAGRRIVFTPYAQLCHYESASKPGLFPPEMEAFRARWHAELARDRYSNPHLSARDEATGS